MTTLIFIVDKATNKQVWPSIMKGTQDIPRMGEYLVLRPSDTEYESDKDRMARSGRIDGPDIMAAAEKIRGKMLLVNNIRNIWSRVQTVVIYVTQLSDDLAAKLEV